MLDHIKYITPEFANDVIREYFNARNMYSHERFQLWQSLNEKHSAMTYKFDFAIPENETSILATGERVPEPGTIERLEVDKRVLKAHAPDGAHKFFTLVQVAGKKLSMMYWFLDVSSIHEPPYIYSTIWLAIDSHWKND